MKYNRGFIELFAAPLILMIVTPIMLVSFNSAQKRGEEASVIATLRAFLPELLICESEGGTPITPAAGKRVCTAQGLSSTWPSLRYGWTYIAPTGALKGSTYTYGATNGVDTIICTIKDGRCVKR